MGAVVTAGAFVVGADVVAVVAFVTDGFLAGLVVFFVAAFAGATSAAAIAATPMTIRNWCLFLFIGCLLVAWTAVG